jgi:hypothetical protein
MDVVHPVDVVHPEDSVTLGSHPWDVVVCQDDRPHARVGW